VWENAIVVLADDGGRALNLQRRGSSRPSSGSEASMRVFAPVSTIACAAVLTGACTDTASVASALHRTRALTASMTQEQPASHPNSEKYRDSGFHPATGRSGGAVVSTRALVDKSGTTDVEVTTGTFDDVSPAPGTLASVQVKAYTRSGQDVFTDNHTALSGGGTASFPYTVLPHGTPLQLQTLVGGVDDPRTDVVTLADTVHLRPDLVAWRLQGSNSSPIGAAVNFQGFILERNGEVGARADCVLYVDGTAVDRADGIWVDAGGSVACAMTHSFTTAGTYSLQLRIENVRPGDFDDTNNSVTGSITIVPPTDFSTYAFQAWAVTDSSWWHYVSTLTTWDGTVETWDQIYTRQGPSQFAALNGLIPRMLDYNAPITFQGEMRTNGTTVNTIDLTYPALAWVDWQGGYCGNTYDFATRADTYICVYTTGRLAGYTFVQYDWSGADVRYHSDSYVYYWDPSGQLHQTWFSNDWTDVGPMVTLGPDFSGRLSVQGANDPQPLTAEATVSFQPVDLRFDHVDPSCSTVPASPGCFELHAHTYGVMGYVDYGSWPPFTP
jgi:hypothetical protein